MGPAPAADPLHGQLPRVLVPRDALVRRLDAIPAGGIGLVVASAGSGKSVLVGQWGSVRPALRVAALTLGDRHEDAVVLAHDLVSAIRTAAPGIDPRLGELVMKDGSALCDDLVQGLLDSLGGVPDGVVLLLEDLHVLSSRAVVGDLGRLLSRLPASTRAVVTTRRDPSWPIHRWRLDGRLVEIRGADLAFTPAQARSLLEGVSRRPVTDRDVATLVDRTDGWAVGLQLAAISLQQAPDIPTFVDSFAGSDRLVAEYLLEEVIDQQKPEVRRFLLETSVLDWLSDDLCDAVTGAGNARVMLDELESRSMFVIPVDPSARRVRYHHLFGDLLRYQLQIEEPSAVEQLHRRAARWLLDHQLEPEAIGHLLAAGHHLEAFDVISEIGHRLYERGESATLVRWLSAIEAGRPGVPVAVQVNLLAAQIALDRVGSAADTHRRIVRRSDLTLGERVTADALYSMLAFRDLSPDTVLRIADEVRAALPRLTSDDVVDFLGIGGVDSIEVLAEYAAAGAHLLRGDPHRSALVLERLLTLPGLGYPVWKVYVLGTLALVRACLGHSTEALRLAASAADTAQAFGIPDHPASTHAKLAAAMAHLDRAEIESAERNLATSSVQVRLRPASVPNLDLQGILEARLAAVRAGPDQGLALLTSPEAAVSGAVLLSESRRALRAHLLIRAGEVAQARSALGGTEVTPMLRPTYIDVALATHDVSTARQLLDRWTPPAEDRLGTVRRLLRSFAVLQAEGDSRLAEAALSDAVATARGDRLRWPFLEVPSALRALRRQPHGSAFADDGLWALAVQLEPRRPAQGGLLEPLTERELEVLAYLPGRMKNHEIADDLYVSTNTIKTHLGSIYRKLGVTERNQAVARATRLGLI